jgi:hypothetical protein
MPWRCMVELLHKPILPWPQHCLEVSGQFSLFSQGKESPEPMDTRRDGPRDGLDDMETWKYSTLLGLKIQHLGHPTCNQSLYQLRYGSSYKHRYVLKWIYFKTTCVALLFLDLNFTSSPPTHLSLYKKGSYYMGNKLFNYLPLNLKKLYKCLTV